MALSTYEVRRRFIDYFRKKGHQEVPSSPVVPYDDPTLLFTNAGMNQFKDVFLGQSKREYTRAVSSQKCIRAGGKHNDLENVGHTTRHLTFFEMLGNFSFGDYFKKEAIAFAWELVVEVFGFEEERLWPTVFLDDDEAFELWRAYVPESRIVRLGEKDNFWSMGEVGPCGPCSELLYDRGPSYGSATTPAEDPAGERFMEFWNIVFMQYNRSSCGKMDPLPQPSIDAGAGLERFMVLIQNKNSVFETDLLRSIIASIENRSGKTYEIGSPTAPAFQVVADHLRSLSFAIADGAQPSNVDRGYVLRKILRRAVRYGRQIECPYLAEFVPDLVQLMGDPFHELKESQDRIAEILAVEEEAFLKTLRAGGNILQGVIDRTKKHASMISGDDAFLLKDTYGLPFEEIELIAIDHSLGVDQKRFQELELEAKERSKVARSEVAQVAEESVFEEVAKTRYVDTYNAQGAVVACIKNGQLVDRLEMGDEGMVVLDATPFYAECGGQIGDTGLISCEQGQFVVANTISPYQGITAHVGQVHSGTLFIKAQVQAEIDVERRKKIAANHTATHLLHLALREIVGEHARQSGSLVAEEYFRFDFCHHKALTPEEIARAEERVNQLVRENHAVDTYELTLEEVQKRSDIRQFFGEKYGAIVRVLEMGPSKELCGGSHVERTGDIGYFRIIGESSIAAGVRRIVAVTGQRAVDEAKSSDRRFEEIAQLLKIQPSKVAERLEALLQNMKETEVECKQLKREKLALLVDALQVSGNDRQIVWGELPISPKELKTAIEEIAHKHGAVIVVLGCKDAHRAHLLVKVPHRLTGEGVHAGNLLKKGLSLLEGNGGGKEEMAQGAGPRLDKLHEALESIVAYAVV